MLRSKPFKTCPAGGWIDMLQEIIPLHGSTLQDGTCQIFSHVKIQDGAKCGKNWISKHFLEVTFPERNH